MSKRTFNNDDDMQDVDEGTARGKPVPIAVSSCPYCNEARPLVGGQWYIWFTWDAVAGYRRRYACMECARAWYAPNIPPPSEPY